MYLSNKTASNNNAKRKELRQELQGKNGVILKKELTGSGFAISAVSGSSEDSQFTESDGMSMVIGGKRIYSKETVQSQRINDI